MKRHINSDHWDTKLDQPDGKIKTQRLETISVVDGKLRRETVVRLFFANGDYMDSESSEVICDAAE
jgi:hypothetical protein